MYMFGYQNYTGRQLTNEINPPDGAITVHCCTACHNDIIAAHDVMGWPSLGLCVGSMHYDAIGSMHLLCIMP